MVDKSFQRYQSDPNLSASRVTTQGVQSYVPDKATANLMKAVGGIAGDALKGYELGKVASGVDQLMGRFYSNRDPSEFETDYLNHGPEQSVQLDAQIGDDFTNQEIQDWQSESGGMLHEQSGDFTQEELASWGGVAGSETPASQTAKEWATYNTIAQKIKSSREQGVMTSSELYLRLENLTKDAIDRSPGLYSDIMKVRNNILETHKYRIEGVEAIEKSAQWQQKELVKIANKWAINPNLPQEQRILLGMERERAAKSYEFQNLMAGAHSKMTEKQQQDNARYWQTGAPLRMDYRQNEIDRVIGEGGAPEDILRNLDLLRQDTIARMQADNTLPQAMIDKEITQINAQFDALKKYQDPRVAAEMSKGLRELYKQGVWQQLDDPQKNMVAASELLATFIKTHGATSQQSISLFDGLMGYVLGIKQTKLDPRTARFFNEAHNQSNKGKDELTEVDMSIYNTWYDKIRDGTQDIDDWSLVMGNITKPENQRLILQNDDVKTRFASAIDGQFLKPQSPVWKELKDDFDPRKHTIEVDDKGMIVFNDRALNAGVGSILNKSYDFMYTGNMGGSRPRRVRVVEDVLAGLGDFMNEMPQRQIDDMLRIVPQSSSSSKGKSTHETEGGLNLKGNIRPKAMEGLNEKLKGDIQGSVIKVELIDGKLVEIV